MRLLQKILVANRGEIAARILRACRAMGIASVAVYSEADCRAPHVRTADEAVSIGQAHSRDSYLKIENILEAARKTAAEAIHPGYGFLAENADFAAACENAGLVFIGPCSQVIRKMGSKIEARRIMESAGVPVVPGYGEEQQSVDCLRRRALDIGLPVLIKASAGGGGRGMRRIADPAGLEEALESARREAESSFGDGTLLLEKYIENARHVEIQIFGDAQGNLVHLLERDCSVQRRHQKIIEESPSPGLSEELRCRMAHAALSAGRAAGYTNAGTVEFLLAPSGEFYFMEMNTRLQVEHPVTEMITGLDLVRLQIEVAEGKPLPFAQEQVRSYGHAIEARLYAEDPANEFLPTAGVLYEWRPPETHSSLRVDSGVEAGMEVGIYYDPLLAKVISHGEDRQAAVRKLAHALRNLCIAGFPTNREFLIRVLEHPEFARGAVHTAFVDERHAELLEAPDPAQDFAATTAVALYLQRQWQSENRLLRRIPPNYRNNPFRDLQVEFEVNGKRLEVSWRHLGGDLYKVAGGNREADAEIVACEPGRIALAVDGVLRQYRIAQVGERCFVHWPTGSREVTRLPRFPARQAESQAEATRAMLPGQVLRILVEEGQHVKVGDALVVLEAMKIEHTLKTHTEGIVDTVLVKAGQVVAPGDLLVRISAQEKAHENSNDS